MNASDIGMTEEQFQKAVIKQAATQLLFNERMEDGETWLSDNNNVRELKDVIRDASANFFATFAEPLAAKWIEEHVKDLMFQETNTYGEPLRGSKPKTLRETVVACIDKFLNRSVDAKGKECRTGLKGSRTYIAHEAMKAIEKDVSTECAAQLAALNETLASETAKAHASVLERLKIEVQS